MKLITVYFILCRIIEDMNKLESITLMDPQNPSSAIDCIIGVDPFP